MTTVVSALARFRDQPTPPEPSSNPFKLSSQLEIAATSAEIERAWPDTPPEQLVEAWTAAREARLFVDVDYGQWGLVLLSPGKSAARTEKERAARPKDFERGDVVIGEFLGDQELLVLTRDGRILVALPLDDRSDWYVAADDLASFLNAYWQHGGDKFWERRAVN